MKAKTNSHEDQAPTHGLALDCGCRFVERDPQTIEWIYTCDPCLEARAGMIIVDRTMLTYDCEGKAVFYPVREFHFRK